MGVSVEPLINYRNKINKGGLYPVHLRITINRHNYLLIYRTAQDIWVIEPDSA